MANDRIKKAGNNVMSYPTVTELEMLTFFECEPSALDATPWPYNDFTYVYGRQNETVEFKTRPANPTVDMVLKRGELVVYQLKALSARDLIYHNDDGRESLEIILSKEHRIFLTLKPFVAIYEEFEEVF